VQDEGGFVLIRATAGMNPQVLEAFREDGQRCRALRQQSLKTLHATRPTRQRVARVVQWHGDECPRWLRLMLSGQRRTKRFCSWLTHLASQRDPLDTMCRA
jgi:hypothetical protein